MKLTIADIKEAIHAFDNKPEIHLVVDTVYISHGDLDVKLDIIQSPYDDQDFDVIAYHRPEGDWVYWDDFPYCDRDSAASVLHQALGWIQERSGG